MRARTGAPRRGVARGEAVGRGRVVLTLACMVLADPWLFVTVVCYMPLLQAD